MELRVGLSKGDSIISSMAIIWDFCNEGVWMGTNFENFGAFLVGEFVSERRLVHIANERLGVEGGT
jgi:hypothetical protein